MKNEFVPFKESLALKDLEFNEPCLGYYENSTLLITDSVSFKNSELKTEGISAPLWQQIFRWFREKHNLHAEPIWDIFNSKLIYFYSISKIGNFDYCVDLPFCSTYEEAELACIRKLIEIVKEND